jgi:DNA-binding MarR family transcriptional regulator
MRSRTFPRSPVHLVRRCHQIQDALFAEETVRFAVTSPQIAALKALERFPGIDQASLAELVAYDHCTLSGVLERLETKGYIRRTTSLTDRRKKLIALTRAGTKMLEAVKKPAERVERRLLAALSLEEQQQFVRMLDRIVAGHEALAQMEFEAENLA